MKADLGKLVSHNSVFSEDQLPFGSENRKVLDDALAMMDKVGLKSTNLNYYCGYGQTGQGDKTIGILAHLDVVPSGEGWDSDPFEMIEKDGYLYGRGVSDDKGAAVASMYALKYLIENDYPFKKTVRLILGCNEESGSRCLAHYVEKEGHIDLGFTPDANFPGIFAEKGIVGGSVITKGSKIIDIDGGFVSNAVASKVRVVIPAGSIDKDKFEAYLSKQDIRFEFEEAEAWTITVYGVAAHASTPELGRNAISYLMEALYESGFDDVMSDYYHRFIGLSLHGEPLGIDFKDQYTDLTFNVGIIRKQGDDIFFTIDIRFPVLTRSNQVIEKMEEQMNDEHHSLDLGKAVEPLFFDPNGPMLRALKKAYADVTGDDQTEMFAIGGGTYSKGINNCIAFGCEFLGADNHIHNANECLSVEEFKLQVKIYIEAIKNLNEI